MRLEGRADRVLEATGLLVHLRPRNLEDVDEQQLGQPVAPQHRGRVGPTGRRQVHDPLVVQGEVALALEPLDGLAHRRRGDAEPVD